MPKSDVEIKREYRRRRDADPEREENVICSSLGSVYRNTEPISDILKYRYRHRRRYSQYQKNTEYRQLNTENTESRFGICHRGLRTL